MPVEQKGPHRPRSGWRFQSPRRSSALSLKRDPQAAARELHAVVDAALAQRGKLAQRDK
jgi:hypothetical protein